MQDQIDIINRWRHASNAAGRLLEFWVSKHPMVSGFMPLVPMVIGVLKRARIEEIEKALRDAGALKP